MGSTTFLDFLRGIGLLKKQKIRLFPSLKILYSLFLILFITIVKMDVLSVTTLRVKIGIDSCCDTYVCWC